MAAKVLTEETVTVRHSGGVMLRQVEEPGIGTVVVQTRQPDSFDQMKVQHVQDGGLVTMQVEPIVSRSFEAPEDSDRTETV